MNSGLGTGSQSLLAGVDNTLDNFFKSGDSSGASSGRSKVGVKGPGKGGSGRSDATGTSSGTKRKRDVNFASKFGGTSVKASPTKKSRLQLSGAKGAVKDKQAKLAAPVERKDVDDTSCYGRTNTGVGMKEKERRALDDVTTVLQNSPRKRTTTSGIAASAHRSPARKGFLKRPHPASPSSRASTKKGRGAAIRLVDMEDEDESDAGSGDAENDVPLRLRAPNFVNTKTPHRMFKDRLRGPAPLPTPPSSSIPPRRILATDEHKHNSLASSEITRQKAGNNAKKGIVHTPFTVSSTIVKQDYPTPASIAVPRLKLLPGGVEASASRNRIPAPNLQQESDSSLTSLSSSSPVCSQVESQVVKEDGDKHDEIIASRQVVSSRKDREDKAKDKAKMYTVIPSSQTQYIHYSPTKKRTYDFLGLNALPRSHRHEPTNSEMVVIPCSQTTLSSSPASSSQAVYMSPRTTRKPAPLITKKVAGTAINLVVPTSQEDEDEISILDERISSSDSVQCSVNVDGHDEENQKQRSVLLFICADRYSYIPTFWIVRIPPRADNSSNPKSEQRKEQSNLNETKPSHDDTKEKDRQATPTSQFRFINAMLADLDRLTEEARLGIVTASQVLSRPRSQSRRREVEKRNDGEESDVDDAREALVMQSSMTEPDASQRDEDPFTLTNEAYARHLGLARINGTSHASESRSERSSAKDATTSPAGGSCTQSSSTQPDSDEEDPFPTLPPAIVPTSTAESTAERTVVDRMLDVGVEEAFSSQTVPDSQDESFPFPERETEERSASLLLQSQVESVSTLDVVRCLNDSEFCFGVRGMGAAGRSVMRFRRRDDKREAEESGNEGEEEETMPSAVRDFLAIFSQSESHS
ncbi:hypothetical protein ACEPAI_6505 [Sanghuangporus weigelae]